MSSSVSQAGAPPPASLSADVQERLLTVVMRRQAGLSLRVAAIFLVPLLALPWINQSQPQLMNARAFGFSVTWLILGICFFPLTWILSAYFVHRSDAIEAECTAIGRTILPPRDAPAVEAAVRVEAAE